MRIERLEIQAFGPLREVVLQTDRPATLIYGPNEAGKSTVLEFIRSVLFGFSVRAGERYTPEPGIVQGGALTLLDEGERRIRVERWDRSPEARGKTPAAGYVRVLFPDGTAGGETELQALLGGVTADVFRQLFAFGLTELQELGTLHKEEISGYLYSAGLGVSGGAIQGAQRKLNHEMDQLYRPRGRTPLMNQTLQELASLQQRMKASRALSEQFDKLREESERYDAQCLELEKELEQLQLEADRLERDVRARPHALQLQEADRGLSELPEALDQVPEDAILREETIEADLERIEGERDRVLLLLTEYEQGLAALEAEEETWRRDLIGRDALEALLDRSSAYEETRRMLLEAEAEEEQLGLGLERQLRRIGPDWTMELLEHYPSTVMLREQAAGFRDEWSVWKREEAVITAELRRLEEDEALFEGQSSFLRLDPAKASEGLERIRTARRLFADWKDAQREKRFAEQRERDWERMGPAEATGVRPAPGGTLSMLLLGIYALTLALPGMLLFLHEYTASGVAFVLLLGISVYWSLSRTGRGRQSSRKARPYAAEAGMPGISGLAQLEARAAGLAAELSAELARLARLGFALGAAESAAAAADALQLPPEDIEPWLESCERPLRDLAAQLEDRARIAARTAALRARQRSHAQAAEPLAARWQAWLREHSLPEQASAEAALELLQQAEAAQGELQRLKRQAARRDALARAAESFAAETAESFAAETAARLGAAAEREPLAALKAWQAARDRALAGLRQADERRRQREELRRQAALLEPQRERALERRRELYRAAGADSGEALRTRFRLAQRRRELLAERRQAAIALRALLGEAEAERSAAALSSRGEAELEAAQRRLAEAAAEVRQQAETAREAERRARFELEQIMSGQSHAEELLLAEEKRAELLQLTRRWAVHALCSGLIAKTKRLFEQDKQPFVMQRASNDFAFMTEGRFTRMLAPLGEQKVLAERADGRWTDTSKLSRGTAEQMYVCIRLALIEQYAASGVRLPIVMDDLFVNFDDERLARGIELLKQVSMRGQLLLFTCHRHVLDAYTARFPADTVLYLQR